MIGFFRKDKANFYSLLSEHAGTMLSGIQALQKYLKEQTPGNAEVVMGFEKKADDCRRTIMDELNKSFSTPIDREDINALSLCIDDIMDYGKSTVEEMELLRIQSNSHMDKMAETLVKAASEINDSVSRLDKNPSIAEDHAIRAKKLENEIEKLYRDAIVDLFSGTDVIYMLKMREIYRHLSNAADRTDEAANVINTIVVKTT